MFIGWTNWCDCDNFTDDFLKKQHIAQFYSNAYYLGPLEMHNKCLFGQLFILNWQIIKGTLHETCIDEHLNNGQFAFA